MEIVVVGAGIGGLGTALMLGQRGHRVTVLERDPAPPADPDEAWDGWDRKGVPQLRLAHVFLSRMRNMIRDEQPDLYAALLDAGCNELTWHESMPATVTDRSPRPIDADLAMLGVRRPVFEQHLRAAAGKAGVEIRSRAAVAQLVQGESVVDGIPHVTGVVLDDATRVDADLVVDCSGRRSALPEWLTALGATPMPEEVVEDGLMYFGRYYQLEDGHDYPDPTGGPIVDTGYLGALTFRADNGWFAIALAVHNEDKDIRILRDPAAFEAALAAIPGTAKWTTGGRARPMTDVASMSRIDDRWRDFVVDGAPLATGLLPVGDSLVATNPAFGRGSSLAWVAARALADVLDEHGGDAHATACAYDARLRSDVRPWFDQTAQMDAARLEQMHRALTGEPDPPIDDSDPMAAFAAGFQLGAQIDPDVSRAMAQVAHVMKQPIELLADPDLAAKVVAAFERRAEIPDARQGPPREELLAIMRDAISAGSPAAAG
jgi:2-polyprenyl-6-methoxyphenol hydroxylase-like FAD-dependent oxidoreductase